MALLQQMYRDWPFFRALLSNMDMALAKTDLALARRYAELVPDHAMARRLFGMLEAEWTRTVKALNAIGDTPQDLLAILQAMKAAGSLRAELEVI